MHKVKNIVLVILAWILISTNSSFANASKYDKLLESLDQEQSNIDKPKSWVLTIDHNKLPKLDGKWVINRKRTKRINTYLFVPVTKANCNNKLPFEERPLEKEIILNSQGEDFFVFKSIFPVTNESFLNIAKTKNIEYQNFGFKGVLIPDEISYVYTLKLINYIENPAFPRQLWLSGKVLLTEVSDTKIFGKGYEIEYTPECQGFIRNEIELTMTRISSQNLAENKEDIVKTF